MPHPRPNHPARPARARARLEKVEETSAGGLVIDRGGDTVRVALIATHDRRGRLIWSLPKGHLEQGETAEQAALREVAEETGLVGRVLAPLGVIDYWFVAQGRRIHKTVHHFLIEAIGGDLSGDNAEVDEVAWVALAHLPERLSHADERRLLDRVPDLLAASG